MIEDDHYKPHLALGALRKAHNVRVRNGAAAYIHQPFYDANQGPACWYKQGSTKISVPTTCSSIFLWDPEEFSGQMGHI